MMVELEQKNEALKDENHTLKEHITSLQQQPQVQADPTETSGHSPVD